MAAKQKNLSSFDDQSMPEAYGMRIGIVVANWNKEITGALLEGTVRTLEKQGIDRDDILIKWVPGSFELPQAAAIMIDAMLVDAVICLGCVIQGETRHFEFISQAVARGCMDLAISTLTPVIFGVLTTDTYEQALERAGGKHGNKGDEAAVAAIQMVQMQNQIFPEPEDPDEPFL